MGHEEIQYDTEDLTDGMAICSGDDCPDPRSGPFLIDLDAAHDGPRTYCHECFLSERYGLDRNDIPR